MKKKERVKSFISFILAFVLMFMICASVISVFIKYKVFDSKLYFDILEDNNTEEQIYNSINNDLHYALVVSNIPKDIADGIITKEEVKYEYDSYFNCLLMYLKTGNDLKEVNTEVYLKRFDEKLNKYLVDNKVVIDDNLKKDISELRSSLGVILKSYLEVVDDNIIRGCSSLKITISRIVKLSNIINYSLFIGMIVIIAVIILIWRKKVSKVFIWISRSLIASGSIFTIVFLSGLISKFYNNVILYTPYVKTLVAKIIEYDVKWFLLRGIIIAASGIIIYVIAKAAENKHKELEV